MPIMMIKLSRCVAAKIRLQTARASFPASGSSIDWLSVIKYFPCVGGGVIAGNCHPGPSCGHDSDEGKRPREGVSSLWGGCSGV